jgi:hypothetical protein
MVHVQDEDSNTAVTVYQPPTPEAILEKASHQASLLRDVVEKCKLVSTISGRKYVKVEGWCTLAKFQNARPKIEAVESREDGSYLAWASIVDGNGDVICRAAAECGRDEPTWMSRPAFARSSMAQTRATGKACRIAYAWIMAMAGYETTPAEEMDGVTVERRPAQAQPHPVDEVVHAEVVKSDVPYDPVVPFGKNKGTPVSKLTDSQLRWYWERVTDKEREGSLSTADGNWKEDLKIHMADRKASREKIHAKQVDSEEIPF